MATYTPEEVHAKVTKAGYHCTSGSPQGCYYQNGIKKVETVMEAGKVTEIWAYRINIKARTDWQKGLKAGKSTRGWPITDGPKKQITLEQIK